METLNNQIVKPRQRRQRLIFYQVYDREGKLMKGVYENNGYYYYFDHDQPDSSYTCMTDNFDKCCILWDMMNIKDD